MSNTEKNTVREYEYNAEGLHLTILCGTLILPEPSSDVMLDRFHTHSWYELFIALHHPLTLHTETGAHTILPGESILVPPGQVHYAEFSAPGSDRFSFSFFLQEQIPGQHSQALTKLLSKEACSIIETDHACCNLAAYLAEALEQENRVLSGTYLLALMLNLAQCFQPDEKKDHRTHPDLTVGRIYKIEQALFTNYTQRLSIKRLAEELNLSERQVSRIVRRHYGTNYRVKNKELRMQSAARSLQNGESIADVAAAEGYRSMSAFYAAFRSTFGMTPAEYKKSVTRQP